MRERRVYTFIGALAACFFAAQASAGLLQWSWQQPDPVVYDPGGFTYGEPNTEINDAGGEIVSLYAAFDPDSQFFAWEATFGPHPSNPSYQQTDAFWLVISPGPMPLGTGGQTVQYIFDASNVSPILTGYAYNGLGNGSSYEDGDGQTPGNQTPDRIFSSLNDPGMIFDVSVIDNLDDTRTFRFAIDATAVNSHSPMYPGDDPWTGTSFGDHIGVWMHTLTRVETAYDSGYVSDLYFEGHGWWDAENLVVPSPGSIALLSIAGMFAIGRRRRPTA